MSRIKRGWQILIVLCIIAGFISFIPLDTGADGTFLPYKSLIPSAPVSSVLLWLLGVVFYFMGRWRVTRKLRSSRY